jgi:hypothetical protein
MNQNMFCTTAIGKKYAEIARYLVADLEEYDQKILVLTDQAKLFQGFKNARIVDYKPHFFSYHDKRLALLAALKISDTAIFIDADCVLRFGLKRDFVTTVLRYSFPPGFHVWKVFKIAEAGSYVYPEKEAFGRNLGLEFDRDRITYQEMLFGLTKENGRETRFFELWNKFEEEATARNDRGAGEGTCMGIAAQGSGLTCHDSKYLDASKLSKLFWHAALDYRKRTCHRIAFKLKRVLNLVSDPDLAVSAM